VNHEGHEVLLGAERSFVDFVSFVVHALVIYSFFAGFGVEIGGSDLR
jgi:hypothetical protein